VTRSPVWHPFTQHGLEEPIPLVTRAEGAILHTADGRRVVDAISSWWVTTHGHCHPRIVAAIAEQAGKLDQLIFAGWTHEPGDRLARELVDLLGLPYVFYSDSGSTSVEVALKMALGFWANRGEPRHRILVLEHSYHGDTIGAMSVGARGVFNRAYAPLLFDVGTIPFPAAGAEQATLDALERACRAEAPAAFIVEPLVLGAGGMLMYGAATLAEMRRICAAHGVLFIADEVMTGWGRTGTLLACEQAGIVPDLLCLAKGLTGGGIPPAGALGGGGDFRPPPSPAPTRNLYPPPDHTPHPLPPPGAPAPLAVWREEPVAERIAALVERQAEGLARLAAVPGIAQPRQCGTIIALDYAGSGAGYLSDLGPRLLAFFRERDLLVRPLGNTAYVMPPYCIAAEDLARVHAALAEAAAL